MSKDVKPLHAVLIVGFFILLVIVYAWANGEAVNLTGANTLHKNQADDIFLRVGHRLLQFDSNESFIKETNLKALGAEAAIGDVLLINNNEVVLRLGKDSRSFAQNLRAFFRMSNTDSALAKHFDSGLYQCNLETEVCNRFTAQQVDFNLVFHLEKDDHDGGVFLSDTDRHRIIKFDAQGNELFVFDDDLKFPNQIKVNDRELYVANTNRKKIKRLSIKKNGLELIENIDVIPDLAISQQETYPASIARVGNHWWIIIMQASMRHGGVYRFDQNWRFINRLDLPDNADPAFLISLHDEVLITDPVNFSVYRFSAAGKRLKNYAPEKLMAAIRQQKSQHDFYVTMSYAPIAVFMLALVAGIIIAVRAELKDKSVSQQQAKADIGNFDSTSELIWFSVNDALIRKLYYMLAGIFVLLVVILSTFYFVIDYSEESVELIEHFIALFVLLLLFPLLLIVYLKHILKAKIGVQGDYIHLQDHRGKTTMGPVSEVYYDNRAIVLNNVAVLTGQKMQPFYDKDKMARYLYPLLEKANRLNGIKMMYRLYKAGHPSAYFEVLIILVCLLIFLFSR